MFQLFTAEEGQEVDLLDSKMYRAILVPLNPLPDDTPESE